MTDEDNVKSVITDIVKDFNGRLDIFVANSGVPWQEGPAIEGSRDHYRKVVSTDFDGTFFCARAAAEHWKRQKFEGTDVNGIKVDSPNLSRTVRNH